MIDSNKITLPVIQPLGFTIRIKTKIE